MVQIGMLSGKLLPRNFNVKLCGKLDKHERMNEQTNIQMDEQMNGKMKTVHCNHIIILLFIE